MLKKKIYGGLGVFGIIFVMTLTGYMLFPRQIAKEVKIQVDNKEKVLLCAGEHVKDAVQIAGITIGSEDKVFPGLDEKLEDAIKIVRVEKREICEEKDIPYEIVKKLDEDMLKGEQLILERGKKGLEKNTYSIVLEDGVEISRELISHEIVKKAEKQVIALGTCTEVTRSGQNFEFEKVITATATGYTHTGRMTYTDTWPSVGTVAVDPKVIPLHSRLYIEGYGYATAKDTGGAIKGNRVDLFFETKAEALKWGRRTVKVYLIK